MNKILHTSRSIPLAVIRVLLGILFLMTGFMKLLVPMLQDAFAGQLAAAGIPMIALNMWVVPISEVVVGAFLLFGILARPAALAILPMMVVATYVHLVVTDHSLFPLQPKPPIIPIVAIVLALIVLVRGAGAWSWDVKSLPK